MSEEPVEFNGEAENESHDNDWENRILCRDESCIGVIGADGRCKECGLPYEKGQSVNDAHTVEPDENQYADAAGVDVSPASDSDDDWEDRTLCRDESCIGVIGADGRCKECGKPYEG
ncbi:MAG: hypothetical protein PVJ37_11440 [Desulfobacterales bacterium]|jgi:hypothetical protein